MNKTQQLPSGRCLGPPPPGWDSKPPDKTQGDTRRWRFPVNLIGLMTIFSLLMSGGLQASHYMGGEITYTHVVGNTYQVTQKIYRDCAGIPLGATSTVNISPVNPLPSVSLTRTTITDITPLCPGQQSRCAVSTAPYGVEEHVFVSNVTFNALPAGQFYTLSSNLCCRNAAITTLTNPGSNQMFLSTLLNPNLTPRNSSPAFLNPPVAFLCAGQPATISPNASDPDGDALVYSLQPCYNTNATQQVSYAAGFSGTNPLTTSGGITINTATGQLAFTPTAAGQVGVVCIRAEEFRNGVKIGEINRDIQVRVLSCTNSNPVISSCPNVIVPVGQQYCVTVTVTDADLDNLTVTSTSGILPAPSFNILTNQAGLVTAQFCWTPGIANAGQTYTISINAQDNACPAPGSSSKSFNITVPIPCNVSITASRTNETCAGASDGTATATMVGGTPPYQYNWTGPNSFTGSTQTISGLSPGFYCVTIVDGNACVDSTCVPVGSSGTPIVINSVVTDANCAQNNGTVTVTASGGTPPYTYQLNGGAGQASGTFTGLGQGTYTIDVTDNNGCTQTGTATVGQAIDQTPPVITCSGNVSVSNDPGQCGAVVTFGATATDDCGSATVAQTAGQASGTLFPIGTSTVTFTATDGSGNTASCSMTVTVTDDEDPTITCPAAVTVSCASAVPAANAAAVASSDNCPGQTVAHTGDTNNGGAGCPSSPLVITRTYTVTDASGNTASCTQTITVSDQIDPVIVCPADATVECGGSTDPSATGMATATDNCGNATVTSSDAFTASCGNSGTIARTWTATDNCGNTSSCVQTITISDNTAPVINCPGQISVFNDPGLCSAVVTFAATATDGCGTTTITYSQNPGTVFPVGSTNVTATATDECGNTSSCTFNVIVDDHEFPQIVAPADVTVACIENAPAADINTVNASDNCPGFVVTHVGDTDNGGSGCPSSPLIITRTYQVTDGAGQSATDTQVITVNDTIPPVITCPADVTLACGASTDTSATGVATATDNCQGSSSSACATVTYPLAEENGNEIINFCGFLPPPCPIPAQWGSIDFGQTNTAINLDIALDADWFIEGIDYVAQPIASFNVVNGVPQVDANWTNATPNPAAPNASVSVQLAGLPNCYAVGVVVQIYTNSLFGQLDPASRRTVYLYNTNHASGPNPTSTSLLTGYCTQNCNAAASGPALSYSDSFTGACGQTGSIARTWTATDDCGNTSSCVQTITIEDNVDPVIACPANIVQNADAGQCGAVVTFAATATDDCGNATVSYSQASGSVFPTGTTTVTATATDDCGNTATCTFTVTVNDAENPTITCPAGVTVSCAADVPAADPSSATASDNCPGVTVAHSGDSDNGGSGCAGSPLVITRTYTATDASGNTASCTQTITVEDSTAPVIICPADLTIACGASTDTSATGVATATDNCNGGGGGGCTQVQSFPLAEASGNQVIDYCGPFLPCFGIQPQWGTIDFSQTSTDLVIDVNLDSDWFITQIDYVAQPTASYTLSSGVPVVDAAWTSVNPSPLASTGTFTYAIAGLPACYAIGAKVTIQRLTQFGQPDPQSTQEVYTFDAGFASSPNPTGTEYLLGYCTQNCNAGSTGPAVSYADSFTGACGQTGSIARTWTATDACGNTASCVQTITIEDNVAPVIACPANIVQNADAGQCGAVVTFAATATDDCGNATVSYSPASGSVFPTGTTTVTATATDDCGNTASCNFTVTVNDAENPTITCPAGVTVSCAADVPAADPSSATASDNCPGVTVAHSGDSDNGGSGCAGSPLVITRTYTATDASGNTASCTQTITVEDSTAPVIICPADLTVACGASTDTSATGVATATDNCNGGGGGGCTQVQSFPLAEASGNQVIDYCGPFLPCFGIQPQWGTIDFSQTSTDLVIDVNLDSDWFITQIDYVAQPTASYTLSSGVPVVDAAWTSVNPSPLASTGTFTYAIAGLPACYAIGAKVTIQRLTQFGQPDPQSTQEVYTFDAGFASSPNPTGTEYLLGYCTQNCNAGSTGPAVSYSDSFSGSCAATGAITRTWTATDACGNTSSCDQIITVVDNDAPVITCPGSIVQDNDAGQCAAVVNFAATATDACGNPTITYSQNPGTSFPVGTTTVTATATDACGNTATCTFDITINDTEDPNAVCQNVSVQVDNNGQATITAADVDGGSTDNCGLVTLSIDNGNFDCSDIGGGSTASNDLFISEYIEGGGNNKCIEIYNGTGAAVNMAGYSIQIYSNGAASATTTINLSGTVADGDVFVVCNSSATAAFTNQADQTTGSVNFNGDDAVVLRNGGTNIDIFGAIGEDPGAQWSTSGNTTQNNTLVRNANVTDGNTASAPGFPSLGTEWTEFPQDFSGDLGSHTTSSASGNTVTLTVTDQSGNTSTCTATVTVTDSIAPVANCQNITVQVDNNGQATITAADVNNGSTDNCGPVTLAIDNGNFDCSDIGVSTPSADLFISEYIEGGGNNKCIEIYNGTGAAVNMAGYSIQIYSNGATSATTTINLTGTVADGDVFVVCNSSATAAFTNQADQTTGSVNFNGDDAVVLRNGGTNIDIFGAIGEDPGAQWSTSGNTTQNNTLVRNANVTDGNTSSALGFPSLGTEWTEFPQDFSGNLGTHAVASGGGNAVTLTVTDQSGNTSTCTANITVEDSIAPIAVCQNVTVQVDNNGNASITAADVDGGSSDNCAIQSLAIDDSTFTCADIGGGSNAADLFISEYIEGGGNNKCIEIYNGTGAAVNLAGYSIQIYSNGASSATTTINLSGSVADGDVYVVCNSNATSAFTAQADQTTGSVNFNGDDAVVLRNGASNIDIFGAIGEDPGSQWTVNSNMTQNRTLVRNANVSGGNTSSTNGFPTLGSEWTEFQQDFSGNLGSHSINSGGNVVTLTVTDVNGNVSTCTANVTVEDSIAPIAVCMNATVQLDQNGQASISATDIDGGSTDNCGIASIDVAPNAFDCSNVGSNNSVTLTVTDVNGNVSSCSASVTVEDIVDPIALCQSVIVQLSGSGNASITTADIDNGSYDNCGIQGLSLDNTSFDCSDLSTVTNPTDLFISEYIEGSGNNKCVEIYNGTGAPVNLSGYAIAMYFNGNTTANTTVNLTGTLAHGDVYVVCSSSADALFTAQADQISGSSFFNGDDAVALLNGGTAIDIIGSIGEDPGTRWSVAGNETRDQSLVRNSNVISGNTSSALGFPSLGTEWSGNAQNDITSLGSHYVANGAPVVTLTVTDVNGNTSTCQASVEVQDNVDPVAVCPAVAPVVQLDGTGNGALAANSGVDGSSTDNCTVVSETHDAVAVNCSNVGANTYVITATDQSGNTNSTTCTFTVEDNVAPNALCQGVTVYLDANGEASITVADIDAGSNDACGIDSLSVDPSDFDCSHVGANTVTLTVTDVNGNVSTCTATVDVQDTIAPTAICQDITVTLDQNGNATITAADIDGGSFDNCGIATLETCMDSTTCTTVDFNNNGNGGSFAAGTQITNQLAVFGITSVTASGGINQAWIFDSSNPTGNDPDLGTPNQAFSGPGIGNGGSASNNAGLGNLLIIQENNNAPDDNAGGGDLNFTFAGGPDVTSITIVDNEESSSFIEVVTGSGTTTTPMPMTGDNGVATATLNASDVISIKVHFGGSGAIAALDVCVDGCKSDFDCSDIGDNCVVLTVTDVNGNQDTCKSTVTIEEGSFVEIMCPSDITVACETGNGGAYVTYNDPTVNAYSSCTVGCSGDPQIPGFIFLGEHDGSRYYCSATSNNTWAQAVAGSNAAGGNLVVINDAAENAFIKNQLQASYAWIGYTDEASEGNFVWYNNDPSTYTNWRSGEPNNQGGSCCQGQSGADHTVLRRSNGQWYDRGGCGQHEYIMEIPCANSVTLTRITGPASGDLFSEGTTTVTYVAEDGLGNADTCSFDVTVEATFDLICPGDITVACDGNSGGACVTWTEPTVIFESCDTNACSSNTHIPGFIYMGEHDGHRYYCSNTSNYTWAQANAAAQAAGGELAVINSASENSYIKNQILASYVWIGLTDEVTEGSFAWVNNDPLSYTNWRSGEPNDQGGACCYGQSGADYAVLRRSNGNWYDRGGCGQYEFVMEVNCTGYTLEQVAGPTSGQHFPEGMTTVTYVAYTDGGDTVSCSFDVTVEECTPIYCNSSGSCTAYEWVERVSVGTINNTSGANGGYADFTSMNTTLQAGSNASIQLEPGFAGQSYTEYWRVWVDWNRDGDFYDSGEQVYQGSGSGTKNGTFNVPASAASGALRMRVSMRWNGCAGPCSNFSYGEVEDYTIYVNGSNTRTAPSAGSASEDVAMQQVSEIDEVSRPSGFEFIQLYPNPVSQKYQGKVDLAFRSGRSEDVQIRVMDMTGRVMFDETFLAQEGGNRTSVDVSRLSSGTYLVELVGGESKQVEKLIVD